VTLELGGKSANIVFSDADVEAAANGLIAGIFAAGGQTCIAGSRALLHEDVYDEVVDRVTNRAKTMTLGDPKAAETELGPIAFPGQHDKIKRYVDQARQDGAAIVTGGDDGGLGGLFYAPTIIAGVTNDSVVCQTRSSKMLSLSFSDEARRSNWRTVAPACCRFGTRTCVGRSG
jgi:aldehyde dehydrogenase (NAD+)